MRAIGFEMVQDRWTPNGKVGYWLYEWRLGEDDISRWEKKTLENEGSKRNNFAIVLPEGMR